MCGNRYVVFNNRTRHEEKKAEQVIRLLVLLSEVLGKNGGLPYTNDLFRQMKVSISS